MKEILDEVEGVIDPHRGFRVTWKIVAIILTVLVGVFVTRLFHHFLFQTEAATVVKNVDKTWYAKKLEEIRATDTEIKITRENLDNQRLLLKDQWVQRSADLGEVKRLSQLLEQLQFKRANIIMEYNTSVMVNRDFDIAPITT